MKASKLVFVLLLGFSFLNCEAQQNRVLNNKYDLTLKTLLEHNVKEVSVKEVTQDTSQIIYLDAREKSEYKVSHIKNAIWIGYTTFSNNKVKTIDKNAKIVVYCSVGYRSEKITQRLIKKGFTNVSNLYGGIFEWKNQNNDVYNTNGIVTEKVHAFDENWGIWLDKGVKVY